jgi:hypothetical protein
MIILVLGSIISIEKTLLSQLLKLEKHAMQFDIFNETINKCKLQTLFNENTQTIK